MVAGLHGRRQFLRILISQGFVDIQTAAVVVFCNDWVRHAHRNHQGHKPATMTAKGPAMMSHTMGYFHQGFVSVSGVCVMVFSAEQ